MTRLREEEMAKAERNYPSTTDKKINTGAVALVWSPDFLFMYGLFRSDHRCEDILRWD